MLQPHKNFSSFLFTVSRAKWCAGQKGQKSTPLGQNLSGVLCYASKMASAVIIPSMAADIMPPA